MIKKSEPDVILLDLALRRADGVEGLRKLRLQCREAKILVFSGQDELLYAPRVLREGASGFVQKQEAVEKLLHAIREVAAGQLYFTPRVQTEFLRHWTDREGAFSPGIHRLSHRELQVFNLIGHGYRLTKIAEELGISQHTVEAHRDHIKQKLKIQTANDLVHYAIRFVEKLQHQNENLLASA